MITQLRSLAVDPSHPRRFVCALAACLVVGCSDRDAKPDTARAGVSVTLYAAASTASVMKDVSRLYEDRTGVRVAGSFASSSTLARQIESGAPADVYVSASEVWMDYLQERGRIDPTTRRDLVSNSLVLIAPKNATFSVRFESGFAFASSFEGRLAMGDPAHVPSGMYAREVLQRLGWWSAIARRILPAKDVRAALAYVELGEVGAGIVYATDAAISDRVEVVGEFPSSLQPRIVYAAAACSDAGPTARAFLEFLTGAEARAVFVAAGFAPPEIESRP